MGSRGCARITGGGNRPIRTASPECSQGRQRNELPGRDSTAVDYPDLAPLVFHVEQSPGSLLCSSAQLANSRKKIGSILSPVV
jgi:hypothetical protein